MFDEDVRPSEDGSFGRCLRCRRRIWVESGCSPLCDSCDDFADYAIENEPQQPQPAGDEE
jgi:hypothetical protein